MLRAQKNLGPETFGNKKIGPHKIWVLKILVPKNFGPEKIWVQNKFRPQKFWTTKILVPKLLSWVGLGWQVQGSVSLVD